MSILIDLSGDYKSNNIILDENYNFSEKDTTDLSTITLSFLNTLTPEHNISIFTK